MSYLLLQNVSRLKHNTFHQIQLELSGQRQILSELREQYPEQIPTKH